jgi:hypothetical protein
LASAWRIAKKTKIKLVRYLWGFLIVRRVEMRRELAVSRAKAWAGLCAAAVVLIFALFIGSPARADSSVSGCITASAVDNNFLNIHQNRIFNSCGQALSVKYYWSPPCPFSAGGCTVTVAANNYFSVSSTAFAPPGILLACPTALPPQGAPLDIGGVYCLGDRQPLTVSLAGTGSGTISGASGISCGIICLGSYATGASVSLTAQASSGSHFVGWGGACSGAGSCAPTMSSAKNVTAQFDTDIPSARVNLTVTGPGRVTSLPTGIDCQGLTAGTVNCSAVFPIGQSIQFTAQTGTTAFAGWGGDCSAVPLTIMTCTVSVATGSAVEVTYATQKDLDISIVGSGNVISIAEGINCTDNRDPSENHSPDFHCVVSLPTGRQVTLTATPKPNWKFTGWSDGCSGTGTCMVTMNGPIQVRATFITTQRIGSVYSSTQSGSLSFLRFFNTGTTSGTVTLTLSNDVTGQTLGTWTSPTIAPNQAPQYSIYDIEAGATPTFAKPSYYSVAVAPDFSGYVQHVLYHPADGTVTNLSTCSSGVTASSTQVANVHSSLLGGAGFPSTVVVYNAGAAPVAAMLGIYSAISGVKLGTYTTSPIAANGEAVLSVSSMEVGAGITATATSIAHYVIKIENTNQFTGHLQHLVNNAKASVLTDMTTVCSLDTSFQPVRVAVIREGAVFSTGQPGALSFLRFANTEAFSTPGTVTFTLADYNTGTTIGSWTTPQIAGGTSPQFAISDIETAIHVPATKPAYYSVSVQSNINGYFQHVLYFPVNGTLTNATTCSGGVTANPQQVSNVHSSRLGALGFPSSIIVYNTGLTSASVILGIYDAVVGNRLAGYSTLAIPANGQRVIPISTLEQSANISSTSFSHYLIKIESSGSAFSGYLQHLVDNHAVGVVTDMTTTCKIDAH